MTKEVNSDNKQLYQMYSASKTTLIKYKKATGRIIPLNKEITNEAKDFSSLEKKAEVITTFPIKIKANENFFRAFTVYR